MKEYYVGTSNDPRYPGIISGPFDSPPNLLLGDFLYERVAAGCFRLVTNGDAAVEQAESRLREERGTGEMMPSSQHDDTMRALKALLSPPSDGEGYYNERMDKALGLVLAALGDSSKPGSPPMGSTPATRRSKRSA